MQAEASGAYGEAKLRKLKSGMNRLEKALAKDLAKVNQPCVVKLLC